MASKLIFSGSSRRKIYNGCYKSDSERRFDSSIGELKRGLARTARTAWTARIDWDTDSTELQVVTTKTKLTWLHKFRLRLHVPLKL